MAQTARGLRYHKLPVLKTSFTHLGALSSVTQCLLLLGQIPSGARALEHRRLAQDALGPAACPGALGILRCIRVLGKLLQKERLETAGTVKASDMGETALQALRKGGVCLLHCESAKGSQWATVTGVELAVDGDKASPRALLLLDSRADDTWGCAHNVRIALKPARARPKDRSLGYRWVCGHLTGEVSRVRLLSLITWTPLAPLKLQ